MAVVVVLLRMLRALVVPILAILASAFPLELRRPGPVEGVAVLLLIGGCVGALIAVGAHLRLAWAILTNA